jgi:Bardet-Biedl syndrome 7 protein
MESQIEDSSWQNNLALLHPLVQEQHLIAKKNQLIDGLKELQLQEDDMNFMSEEYKDILKNADLIRA